MTDSTSNDVILADRLFIKYQHKLKKFARSYHDLLDAESEANLQFLKCLQNFNEESSFNTYLSKHIPLALKTRHSRHGKVFGKRSGDGKSQCVADLPVVHVKQDTTHRIIIDNLQKEIFNGILKQLSDIETVVIGNMFGIWGRSEVVNFNGQFREDEPRKIGDKWKLNHISIRQRLSRTAKRMNMSYDQTTMLFNQAIEKIRDNPTLRQQGVDLLHLMCEE